MPNLRIFKNEIVNSSLNTIKMPLSSKQQKFVPKNLSKSENHKRNLSNNKITLR